MRIERIAIALTVVNLGLLILLLTRIQSVSANGPLPVLRGSGLEIVDNRGEVRASIQIVPAGPARRADGTFAETNGIIYPEAVLLRLVRPDGRPSVKIETSEQGSGLSLSGGSDPGYIVLSAKDADTSLALTDKEGHRQLIKP